MTKMAKDIMSTDVTTVDFEDRLTDVYQIFVEKEISGAPVIGEGDRIVGVVSIRDLLRAIEEESDPRLDESYYFHNYNYDSWPRTEGLSEIEDFQDRLGRRTVAEVMTNNVISVSPSVPVGKIAALVRLNHIHRVLVLDDEKLVGLVSLFDLIQLLE
jgi:CBS domain-containing protein